MKGNIVLSYTYTPSQEELENCPHIELSSPVEWEPTLVGFTNTSPSLDEEVARVKEMHGISGVSWRYMGDDGIMYNGKGITDGSEEGYNGDNEIIIDIGNIDTRIIGNVRTNDLSDILNQGKHVIKKKIDIGTDDVPERMTFQSKGRHTDVSPEDLSERWVISVRQATETLKRTTQKFIRSAILPLARRYRVDRMFERKTLSGSWSTDTMDGRIVSLDGNRYLQVFELSLIHI